MDFLRHDAVREEIENASGKMKTKAEHTWDVLSVLVDRERAQIGDIVPYVDVSRSSVSGILSKLADHGVVEKTKRGQQRYYQLNTEGVKGIIQQQRKREEMSELKEQVKG